MWEVVGVGSIVISAILDIVLHYLLNPFLQLLSAALQSIAHGSLAMAQAPWVGSAEAVTASVAGGVLGLYIAWKALTEYILWNEGSPNLATSYWVKAILRVMVYGALGGFLPYAVFSWGIQFGGALMAAPVASSLNPVATLVNGLTGETGLDVLVIALMLVVVLIALFVVFLQMFIRGAELAIYVIGAPLVALGWMNPDGGIWQQWWKGLVILSLSAPVQWLALHGLVATVVIDVGTKPLGAFEAILEMAAWIWVAIRGPHMLQQWAYRSGLAGMGGSIGGVVLQQGGLQKVKTFIGGKVG
jgi:hypothetical protein